MIATNSTLNIIEHINLFKNLSSTLNDTTFTINENLTNGTIIGSLSASNIYGDDLVYSIISGNELNGFALDTARGILSVLDSSIIDFELNPSYKLLVSVGGDRLTDSLTVDINIVDNIESPFLCSVQSNENNFNVVRWTTTQDVLYHNIYREESTGRFELIGQVSFNSNQLFVDSTSNVQARSYKYLLTAVNSDSVESEPSRIHQTILLQAGEGINNDVLLTWNQYEGIEYDNIEILRGSNENNLEVIATLSSNNFRYTDLTPVDAQKFIEFVSHLMIFVLAVI